MAVDFTTYIDANLNDENLNAWDGSSSMIDPGEYLFEIVGADVGQSKKGNAQLEVKFKVADQNSPMHARECRAWYSLKLDSTAARGRLLNLVKSAGVPIDTRGGFDSQALVGSQLFATVYMEDYETNDKDGNPVTRTGTRVSKERPIEVAKPVAQPPAATTARGRAATGNGRPAVRQ